MKALIMSDDGDIRQLVFFELAPYFKDITFDCNGEQEFDLVICDLDTHDLPKKCAGKQICFSRTVREGYGNFLLRPFSIDEFIRMCTSQIQSGIREDAEKNVVYIDGRCCPLTPREFSLFSFLHRANGQVVPSKVLLDEVFDGSDDRNLLSVYIHYLRKKTEKERRMIFSYKGKGYFLKTGDVKC